MFRNKPALVLNIVIITTKIRIIIKKHNAVAIICFFQEFISLNISSFLVVQGLIYVDGIVGWELLAKTWIKTRKNRKIIV